MLNITNLSGKENICISKTYRKLYENKSAIKL